MSWGHDEWGAFLSFALCVLFFGFLAWAFPRRRRDRDGCVADGPADEPYRVYTGRHDRAIRARDAIGLLSEESPDLLRGWMLRNPEIWQAKIEAARAFIAQNPNDGLCDRLCLALRDVDVAICLLIDHSGSMRGESIVHTAAAAKWLSDCLQQAGTPFSLLGFSTIGWHGGKAYQDWRSRGQPKRPGRLCALLHIEYQSFGQPLADDEWEAMLHPDVLRENVDGEAILWACEQLRVRHERRKLLIVLSDGAPVDDKTLEYNGPNYLWRHLESTIAEVEEANELFLAAVGINYRVDGLYRHSRSVETLTDLPEALSSLIIDTVGEKRTRPNG